MTYPYIGFCEPDKANYTIALMAYDLNHPDMYKNYILGGLMAQGAPESIENEVIAYKIPHSPESKTKKRKPLPVKERREYLLEMLEIYRDIGIRHIIVAQPDYFKTLTGRAKAALEAGALYEVDQDHFEGFDFKVTYAPNFRMAFYDPEKTAQGIALASQAIVKDRSGSYQDPGKDIIHSAYYPMTDNEIEYALNSIISEPMLTVDIEGFSLDHHDAGIASIAFAWDEHNGIAFQVDWAPDFINLRVRQMLRNFFIRRAQAHTDGHQRSHTYHNAGYDVTVLIHQLSKNALGTILPETHEGLFKGFTAPGAMHDTKIISYLATNSTAGNKLSLKDQSVEFAGNYAVDVSDVTKVPVEQLLEYNLIDALCTWYVAKKHEPTMIQDDQQSIYYDIMLPSLKDIIDMQLNGLPIDIKEVADSKKHIEAIRQNALNIIQTHPIVVEYTEHLKRKHVEKRNQELKTKQITVADVDLEFNPASSKQLAGLLYDPLFMDLPILKYTASGAASTKGECIEALQNSTNKPDIEKFLGAVKELKDCNILLSTFIPAMESARWNQELKWHFMHGNFNLGGTVSGRLSSSDPNLQNIPSKSRLAKLIKKCVKAPPGWLFCGLDFDSLEDKISALLTKDPNKLKVYTDGYDGHSLRAYSYFGSQMSDIDFTSVESINSIGDNYPELRQKSKAPTFLLTYGGTYHGLMGNCGFDESTAKQIERQYHQLYQVSDKWVEAKINGAVQNGYVEVAFGLRVRTPILSQVVLTQRHTPYAAMAESRTAGNALGQSWGLLNNRAASKFMQKVDAAGYRKQIRICCQIHDAQYYLVKKDPVLMRWFNRELVQCVSWQDHPDIWHEEVKLSGQTSIFYPSWAEEHTIPNGASIKDINEIGYEIIEKLEKENAS